MIYDSIKNLGVYKGMHPHMDCAIDFILGASLETLEGFVAIDGNQVFANVMHYEPKAMEDGVYESHRRCADIQIVVEGKELLYNAPLEEVTCTMPYDEVKDIAFYKGEAKSSCILEKGKFVICMPTDAHMPGITYGVSGLKKIVVKVKLD
ncbi:MAG: YhcH/YjgK/YiaL family protein [Cellulosilyticaceae bacterium]